MPATGCCSINYCDHDLLRALFSTSHIRLTPVLFDLSMSVYSSTTAVCGFLAGIPPASVSFSVNSGRAECLSDLSWISVSHRAGVVKMDKADFQTLTSEMRETS